MKSEKDILRRAIILLSLADRVILESEKCGNGNHSLLEREEQRTLIFEWLSDFGYIEFCTAEEKYIFETKIGILNKQNTLLLDFTHECIEPLLWSINLNSILSKYDKEVPRRFYNILNINENHSFDYLLSKSKLIEKDRILEKQKISLLWHWRNREAKKEIFLSENVQVIIDNVFGPEYTKITNKIDLTETNPVDFKTFSKPYYKANDNELFLLQNVAFWRHKAFNWILSDENWDDIHTNTY